MPGGARFVYLIAKTGAELSIPDAIVRRRSASIRGFHLKENNMEYMILIYGDESAFGRGAEPLRTAAVVNEIVTSAAARAMICVERLFIRGLI